MLTALSSEDVTLLPKPSFTESKLPEKPEFSLPPTKDPESKGGRKSIGGGGGIFTSTVGGIEQLFSELNLTKRELS